MEATTFGCAAAKIDDHDKNACGSSSASGEMDDKLDGALPDLLNREDASTKRLQGIRFENLSLTVRNPFRGKKELLFNLSGHFPSGQLSAIIGPSGSGKSSLLAVLAGHRRPSEGQVAPRGQRRRHIAQQCVFPEVLTALEALTAAAALKLNAPPASRRAAVRRVLAALSLTQCAHTPCHALSGGQRKRLSVALELIDEPPVLLLDEPTTGLDCVTGLRCIRLLQRLARTGSRTIVCTIHQPSARLLELMDQIYLLAAGHCLYRGSVDGLLPKLASHNLSCPTYHNPADFALDVACGEYGSEVISKLVEEASYLNNCAAFDDLEKQEKGQVTSFWTQFSTLTKRSVFITFQEKSVMYVKIVVHLVVAIMLGILFTGIGDDASRAFNNAALQVCVLIFLFFCGIMPTILTFPLQKRIFKSEFSNCWYSMEPYFLASFVSQIPLPLFNTCLFTTIVYWMSGQPNDLYIFGVTIYAATMTSLISNSMGHIIGIVAGLSNGMFLGPLVGVPQFVFCGYFIALSGTPLLVRIIAHTTSYTLYSFHAIMSSTFGHDRPKMQCHETYCYFRSPNKILDFLDMKEEGIETDLAVLLTFLTVIQICTYLAMKLKYRHLQS